MAITVKTDDGLLEKVTGITTGNEYIFKVDPTKPVKITGFATSTGDARVMYSTDASVTPTDLTAATSSMVVSSLGSFTDEIGEEMGVGIEWVAVDVVSGTWTSIITQPDSRATK